MAKRILAFFIAAVVLLGGLSAALAETAETTAVTGTGTAKGFGGDVTVTVTLADGVITIVDIEGPNETQGIGSNIVAEWPEAFVEANGIVDTYTGATFASITRKAVIEATIAALTAAGVNANDYMREYVSDQAEDVALEADVVVVGAGGAGMTAAIVAADMGCKVVVIDACSPD